MSRKQLILWSLLAIFALIAGWTVGGLQAAAKRSPLVWYEGAWDVQGPFRIVPVIAFTNQLQEKPRRIQPGHERGILTPADKTLPRDRKPVPLTKGDHLLCYNLEEQRDMTGPKLWNLDDQFGRIRLSLRLATELCEPADKEVVVDASP
jgi:hypothetical protein